MITQEKLKELLEYDPETGVFTRKVRTANAIKVGDIAGCINNMGYITISVLGRPMLAHRLAWLYVYGEIPPGNLDHADRRKTNNAIGNLRLCNQSQNTANSPARRGNRSGYKGVSFHSKRKKWRARITLDYKEKILGYFDTPEEAHRAYCKAAVLAFGEFHIPS